LVKNTSNSKKTNEFEATTEKDVLTDIRYEVYQMEEGEATTPNQKQKKKQAIAHISIPADNEVNHQFKPQVSNHVKQVSFSSVPYDALGVSPLHSDVASQKVQSFSKFDASPALIKKEIFLQNQREDDKDITEGEKIDDLEAGEENYKLQVDIQNNQLEVEDIA